MKVLRMIIIPLLLLVATLSATAEEVKEYRASMFGIKSDGVTVNTRSIQHAIDYISENGGGRLLFYVGRYLTGTIHLKSNVELHLKEGAILVGSTNPYDYDYCEGRMDMGLIMAYKQHNIKVTGQGVVDGQGRQTALNRQQQIYLGYITDDYNNMRYDRASRRPNLFYFRECSDVTVDGIIAKNSAMWTLHFDQCDNLLIQNVSVDSKNYWNNDGIDVVDCNHVLVQNCYVDASDDAICLKSHDANKLCQNVEVRNCVARSSANGIKFGTMGVGGFKNIKIINNKVYDTYRSAFTIASVDGGIVDNVLVDSLYSANTGNAIYLRIGDRRNKRASLRNVTIQNSTFEVVAHKADSGYMYEGPIEDNPRNLSPASIVGLAGNNIEGVTLRNVQIIHDGGGNRNYAYRGTSNKELESIPEMEKAYPEFSQFKELPAWGFYVRHAKDIVFDNVTFTLMHADYRPVVVMSDVNGVSLKDVRYHFRDSDKPITKPEPLILHKCTKVEK